MWPNQLPQWLDYAMSENTAAAMFRGLQGLSARWGELIGEAEAVMGIFQDLTTESPERFYEEQNALPLIAASRILDAASQPPSGLPEADRQYLAVVAAVAFAMYGNFPSATAVVRRMLPTFPFDSQSMAVIFATAAPHLLGEMLSRCASGSPEKTYLELLEAFLSTGDARRIEGLREALIKCLLAAQTPFEGGLLRSSRLCLEHLFTLSVARTLHEHCGILPEAYIRRLVDSGVRVLFPPQFRAITQHPLLTGAENAIVALPTSTGKTLLGELCLVAALQQQPGTVCYLAPYVALGRQVAQSLEDHLPEPFRVRRMIGGFREEEAFDLREEWASGHRREIIVATPERFDALLRTMPGLIADLRCVVCDEAHLLQNDVRGIRLEGLITRMRLLQERGYPLRLVLLSAVLSRYDTLRQWIGAPEAAVVTDTWRPTARRIAFWREHGHLTWYVGDNPIRRPGTASDSTIGQLDLPWPASEFYPTSHFGQVRKQEPFVHTNIAYLAEVLWRRYGGSILCVCATKDSTRKVAAALARRLPVIDPLPQGIASTIARIEKDHTFLRPMCGLLRRGVAFHNSTVPHTIRQAIEDAVQKRELLAVAATTTLAEGVDLPFRFTILVDWLTWQGNEQRPISSLLFRNVAGRCGRAGVFTEGDTIVFDNPLGVLKYTSPPLRRAREQRDIFLQQPRVVGDGSLAGLGSALLRALGTLPEQTHQNLRKVLATKRTPFPVKPDDFPRVLNGWLGDAPLEHIFAELPFTLRSTRQPKINAWLHGESGASEWNAEFDKFVDFTRVVIGGFLPWLMRACGRLSAFTGGWATEIPWKQWADKLESPVDPLVEIEEIVA